MLAYQLNIHGNHGALLTAVAEKPFSHFSLSCYSVAPEGLY